MISQLKYFRATINLVENVNVYNEPKWSAKKRTRVIKLLQSTTLGYYVFAVLVLGGAVAILLLVGVAVYTKIHSLLVSKIV